MSGGEGRGISTPAWRSLPCEQGKAYAGQGGSHVLIGGKAPHGKGRLRQRKGAPRTREGHRCLWGHAGPSPSLPLRAGGEFSAGRLGGRAGYEDEDAAEERAIPTAADSDNGSWRKKIPRQAAERGSARLRVRGCGGGRHLESGEGEGKSDGRGDGPKVQGHERAHGGRQPCNR